MAANRLCENEKRALNLIIDGDRYEDTEGVCFEMLKYRLSIVGMSPRVIWKAVKLLVNEGHICYTIDKTHYVSTHFKYQNVFWRADAIKVLCWIECFQDAEQGISLRALKQGLSISDTSCEEAVRFLINKGHIHYTTDQYHYMSADIINNVLRLIKSCQDAKGISLQDLRQGLCGMNMSWIRQALEYLSNKGLIFSSVDGHHYKLTDTISKVLSLIKRKDIKGISLQDLKERLNVSLPVIRQAVEFLSKEGHVFSDDYHNHSRLSEPITYRHMAADTIAVLKAIRAEGSRHVVGICLQDLEVACGALSLPVIWKAVEYLSNEGLIYSTIDQYHYTNAINDVLSLINGYRGAQGISLQELNLILDYCSMPVIMQAVKSLIDDGLIFSSTDGCHYKWTDTIPKVLKLIDNCTAVEGISLQDLKQGLNGMSMPAIWHAVVWLKDMECIYSTINMDHYKRCKGHTLQGMDGFSPLQDDNAMAAHKLSPNQKVLSLIKSCQDAEGISLQDLEERLGDMSLPVIWQAIESLSNEGYIYSTIDQYHYTSTDIINKVLLIMELTNGICISDLARVCGRSLPVIKQAVESLIDDGLIFSPDDGWQYKLTGTINKVLSLIKSSEEFVYGISLQDMKQRLDGISMPSIWQAVLYLRKERHILDTIDMEHYMSTETLHEGIQGRLERNERLAQEQVEINRGLQGQFPELQQLVREEINQRLQGVLQLLQQLPHRGPEMQNREIMALF